MAHRLLPVAMLFAAFAMPANARASGVNLSWDDCGAHGTLLKINNCDTNAGSQTLVGSFVAPSGIDSLNGNSITVDIMSWSDPLPDWWRVGAAGTCRQNSLTVSFDFAGRNNCFDYWAGRQFGAWTFVTPFQATNRARFLAAVAIPAPMARPINEGVEVYSFRLTIDNARTVGDSACAGCGVGACIALSSIKLTQNYRSVTGTVFLGVAADGQLAAWQCGSTATPSCHYTTSSCGWDPPCSFDPACATPVRRRTWGAIKSLYR